LRNQQKKILNKKILKNKKNQKTKKPKNPKQKNIKNLNYQKIFKNFTRPKFFFSLKKIFRKKKLLLKNFTQTLNKRFSEPF